MSYFVQFLTMMLTALFVENIIFIVLIICIAMVYSSSVI